MTPRLRRQSDRFLVEATQFVGDEGLKEVDLVVVPSPQAFGLNNNCGYQGDIETIAKDWENRGIGTLRIVDHQIMTRPYFRFSDKGFREASRISRKLHRRPLRHKLKNLNWAAVSALAAVIAAVAAVAAAYFSYLSLSNH